MNGIVSGIDYSLLYSGNTSNVSSSILSALYSGNSTASGTAVSTGSPLTDLKLAQANEKAEVAKEAKQPIVARDIAAFTKAVSQAKDIDSALSNPSVLKVLLTANGLGSQVQYPGLAKKVLLSDPSQSDSLVNRMGSTAWTNTTKAFNFAKNGLSALNSPTAIASLTNAYAEVMWRQSLDTATPGLSNALAFLDQAKSIKTVDDILGDPINRAVVTTALGIPQQIAFQSLEAQETAITNRLQVDKLQDPKFVKTLTDQYLLTMQQNASSSSQTDMTSLAVQASSLVV